MQTYVVQSGDTLYGISKQFGVSVDQIKTQNNIQDNSIIKGQVLLIPTTETTILYIVKAGDSLYSIARQYDVSVSELMQINNLTTNIISIGQELRIPIGEQQQNYTNYTVKKGDSLYSIANTYKISVDDIKKVNNLSSNLLSIGQTLKIPTTLSIEPTPEVITYTVKSGDSLYSIATKYKITVDELKSINNLTSNILQIGQVLTITKPMTILPDEIEECYGTEYSEPTFQTYTVKKGDNLYTIAKAYNTSVSNIISLNNLSSNNLSIGQVLKIKELS